MRLRHRGEPTSPGSSTSSAAGGPQQVDRTVPPRRPWLLLPDDIVTVESPRIGVGPCGTAPWRDNKRWKGANNNNGLIFSITREDTMELTAKPQGLTQ